MKEKSEQDKKEKVNINRKKKFQHNSKVNLHCILTTPHQKELGQLSKSLFESFSTM